GTHRDLGDARRVARPVLVVGAGGRRRAHRVVRDRRHHARTRRPVVTVIVPCGSAYRGDAVQLDLPTLDAGARATVHVPDGIEAALVLLAGDVDLGTTRASRADVFAGPATAVYLPPGSSLDLVAHAPTELALAATAGDELHALADASPAIVAPDDVVVHDRGRPGWQRAVHDIVAGSVPAQRLLVG